MAVLEWRSDFSIGNDAVDNDHQHLIGKINQIYAALADTTDSLSIETMLEELQTDISEHFALEELLMHQSGFAEYEMHRQDHETLLDQINDMVFSFSEDPGAGRELLLSQLSDWFATHFTTFDARLHNQLGA
jgi:hemerythrin